MEIEISRMMALAAGKLLQKGQAEAAQQQAQQAAQDPIVQMQQQELQLKSEELKLKQTKTMADIAAKQDQLEIEDKRIEAQKEIAGMQVGAKTAKDRADLQAKMQLEGVRIGSEVARTQAQMDQQKRNTNKPTRGE